MAVPDVSTLRGTFKQLQAAQELTSSHLTDISTVLTDFISHAGSGLLAFTCAPGYANALVTDVYAACANVYKLLGTPYCDLEALQDLAQQGLVKVILSASLCFSGVLQPGVSFAARLAQLTRWQVVPNWSDAAVRLSKHLQQPRQQWEVGNLPAVDVAGALLTFWVPFAEICKDATAFSSLIPTISAAAELAAAVLRTWPSPHSTFKQSRDAILNSTHAVRAALDAGNALASVLDDLPARGQLAELPEGLLQDNTVVEVPCAHLAHTTHILHTQSKGISAVKFEDGVSSSSKSSNKERQSFKTVPADHTALLTAVNLQGYFYIDPDRAANTDTVLGACRALSLVLVRRLQHQQQRRQTDTMFLQQQIAKPLLQVGVELLLLLGPADLQCTYAILAFLHVSMLVSLWCKDSNTPPAAAAAAGPAHSSIPNGQAAEWDLGQLVLLQVGPLVLMALKEGKVSPSAPATAERYQDLITSMLARMVFAIATTGVSKRPISTTVELAPLTASSVLEAMIRGRGFQHQQQPAAALAAAAAARPTPDSGPSVVQEPHQGPKLVVDYLADLSLPAMLLLMQLLLIAMLPEAAVAAGSGNPMIEDPLAQLSLAHTADAAAAGQQAYQPSVAAEVQATTSRGLSLVQIAGLGLSEHAMYGFLLSCVKYASAMCNSKQYRLAGIIIGLLALQCVTHRGWMLKSALPSSGRSGSRNRSGSSSSSGDNPGPQNEAAIRFAVVLAARCCQLIAKLVDPTSLAADPKECSSKQQQEQQQQQCDAAAVAMRCCIHNLGVLSILARGVQWLQQAVVSNWHEIGLHQTTCHSLQQQLEGVETALQAAATSQPPNGSKIGQQQQPNPEQQLQDLLKSLPLQIMGQLLDAAETLQQQLPVRFCCNYDGCTELKGTGELEMVSVPGTRCSACRAAYYCTPACQKAAWRGHKPVCARLKQQT